MHVHGDTVTQKNVLNRQDSNNICLTQTVEEQRVEQPCRGHRSCSIVSRVGLRAETS